VKLFSTRGRPSSSKMHTNGRLRFSSFSPAKIPLPQAPFFTWRGGHELKRLRCLFNGLPVLILLIFFSSNSTTAETFLQMIWTLQNGPFLSITAFPPPLPSPAWKRCLSPLSSGPGKSVRPSFPMERRSTRRPLYPLEVPALVLGLS